METGRWVAAVPATAERELDPSTSIVIAGNLSVPCFQSMFMIVPLERGHEVRVLHFIRRSI